MADPYKSVRNFIAEQSAFGELERHLAKSREFERQVMGMPRALEQEFIAASRMREMQMIDELINPPHVKRMIEELTNPPYMRSFMAAEAQYKVVHGHLAALNQLTSPAADMMQKFADQHRAFELGAQLHAIVPAIPESIAIAERMAAFVEPHKKLMERFAWEADLAVRMTTIETPWAFAEQVETSGFAFTRLARFADGIRFDEPYTADTRAYIVEELGDVIEGEIVGDVEEREARFDEAGRDPALVAFPAEAYSGVLVAARFELILPPPAVPQPIEGGEGEGDFTYDGAHNALLGQIEQHLRQFVDARMAALHGPDWIDRRAPRALADRWRDRQEDDRRRGRPVFPLIQYADFMDLAAIMGGNANWRDAFGTVFREKMWMTTSLQRLHPIRLNLAHARPISQSDVLCLMSEGIQLMRAIGQMPHIQ